MRYGFFLHSLKSHPSIENLLLQVFPRRPKIRYHQVHCPRRPIVYLIYPNMHPSIRTLITMIFLCSVAGKSFGGSWSARPVHNSFSSYKDIKTLDSFLSEPITVEAVKHETALSSEEASASSGRICSCQILNLESSNYDHRYVVLLAEKKTDGKTAAYTIAKNRIQKEKKHLKKMFYDRVQVVTEMQGTGTCHSMFIRLKTADRNLQLYEILNADIN
jgi:hypothetical protein